MDKSKFQYEGLKWLHELELLNHPQVVNTIKFNVLVASKHIREVELLIYRENKTMLVLLDLSWLGRKFFKKNIFADVQDALTQLLPSFRFRVTDDRNIMRLAIGRVQRALTGGKSEIGTNSGNVVDNDASQKSSVTSTDSISGSATGIETSQEEQSGSIKSILNDPSKSNSSQG